MRLQRRRSASRIPLASAPFDAAQRTSLEEPPPDIDAWLDMLDRFLRLPSQQKLSIREELRSHLSERVRDLMLSGADRDRAMRQAINELGEAAELAERFRHANHYPRRRLIMNALLAGVCTSVVIGAVAVMNTSGNNNSTTTSPAFFAAQPADDQRALLDDIHIDVMEDMTARQIVEAMVATEKIGVYVDWSPIEEIGINPDDPLGFSGKEVSVSIVLNELARRTDNTFGGLDWRVTDRVLTLDTKHAFDRRERVIACYDIEQIVNRLSEQYNTPYSEAIDEIRGAIINLVDPDLWLDNGGDIGQIQIVGGRMFVNAPLRMHEKTSWILGELSKPGAAMMEGMGAAPAGASGGGGGAAGGAGLGGRPEPSIMPNPTDAERAAHAFYQKAMAQLRNIHMAVQIWNQSDQNELGNLGQLVAAGMLTHDGLRSPAGPAPDEADYWIDLKGIIQPGDVDLSKRVVGIDRAMYEDGDPFAVLFADGHVEIVTIDRLKALWKDSANDNVAPQLPQRKLGAAAEERILERYPLSHVDAQSLAELLTAIASAKAEIQSDAQTNSVFIAGPAEHRDHWTQLLQRLDHAQQ